MTTIILRISPTFLIIFSCALFALVPVAGHSKILPDDAAKSYIGELKICSTANRLPIESIKNNRLTGISGEYIALVSQQLNVKTSLVETAHLQESIDYLADGKCDLIASFPAWDYRSNQVALSTPYFTTPLVFVSAKSNSFFQSFVQLFSHRVAVVDEFANANQISRRFENYTFVPIASIAEGLEKVTNGQVHSLVSPLVDVGDFLQRNYIPNIRISGHLEERWGLSLAVRPADSALMQQIDAAIANISSPQKQSIDNDWIKVNYQYETDYHLLFSVIIVGGLLFFGLLYRHLLLTRHAKSLHKISQTDKLTGLYNRVKTDEALNYHINCYRRYNDTFSIILLDIDNFKVINDQFGHMAGDDILVNLADVLTSSCRNTDIIGRWGGEEFLIICPKADLTKTRQITEKLQQNIQSIALAAKDSHSIVTQVSASFGVAEISIEDTHHSLVSRADKALLQAKQNGKNQFVIAKTNLDNEPELVFNS